MYSFVWDSHTGGYRLTTQTVQFIASEIRPVFAEEIDLTGLKSRLSFDLKTVNPVLWAKQHVYLYRGVEIARLNKIRCGKPMEIEWRIPGKGIDCLKNSTRALRKKTLVPVNVGAMVTANSGIMNALVADTLKRIKEMYDAYVAGCDAVYIGFSGGKDSVVLLDLCHKVLPLDIPVVFSDTNMELPDTYSVWDEIQDRYKGRPFLKVSAKTSALDNWKSFGPPSQVLRWCCSVHKSTPAILAIKERLGRKSVKTLAFVGVRGEESLRRSEYDDIGDGMKSQSQVNAMPILAWSAHEIWLYIFGNDLVLNKAYRKGLPRVGCLLCPMSSARQSNLIRMSYPEAVAPFAEVVRESIDREFSSKDDAEMFVFDGGWYARKSGVSLKQVIAETGVERRSDRVFFELPSESEPDFKEWLKAIGKIEGALLSFQKDERRESFECVWTDGKVDKVIVKWLVYAVHKAIACIGCKACEAECPTGALRLEKITFSGKVDVSIDEALCIHCMKCFSPDEGCLRYYSKRYAGATTVNISGINKYMTFGLKPEWIEVLAKEGSNFRQTTALGNRMVPAAVTWFREAGLIENSTAIITTLLMDVGRKLGFSDMLLWRLIWFRLVNTSPLVKWFVCNTAINNVYPVKLIDEMLANSVGSASVRKGAIQSLCQLFKTSPLGEGDGAIIRTEMKGRAVEKLTRRSCTVEPLLTLYSLYVMSEKCGRGAFTIRQMMTAEFEGEAVSPITAFGISPDEFKKQCMGLAAVHPDFISCSFTLGLDEVLVFPESKSRDDVVLLILD